MKSACALPGLVCSLALIGLEAPAGGASWTGTGLDMHKAPQQAAHLSRPCLWVQAARAGRPVEPFNAARAVEALAIGECGSSVSVSSNSPVNNLAPGVQAARAGRPVEPFNAARMVEALRAGAAPFPHPAAGPPLSYQAAVAQRAQAQALQALLAAQARCDGALSPNPVPRAAGRVTSRGPSS